MTPNLRGVPSGSIDPPAPAVEHRVLKRREVTDLRLVEGEYIPNVGLPTHAHELAYYSFVLEGAYTDTNARDTRDFKPLTLRFHPPGWVHSVRVHGAGLKVLTIDLEPTWLARIHLLARLPGHTTDCLAGPLPRLAIRLYNEFHEDDEASSLALEGLTLELLAETSRRRSEVPERRPPGWLREAKDLLHEHYDKRLSLVEIADAVGVHPVHLARAFREQYRCTVGEYVRQLRIDCACRLLSQSDAPLAEVALAAGFSDQSRFTKTFKRLMGTTPAAFRKDTGLR